MRLSRPGCREVHHAAVLGVADGTRRPGGQVARVAGFQEARLDRLGDLFGETHHREPAEVDRRTVGDQAGHGLGVYQFAHGCLGCRGKVSDYVIELNRRHPQG
jgi:hypothetical protein